MRRALEFSRRAQALFASSAITIAATALGFVTLTNATDLQGSGLALNRKDLNAKDLARVTAIVRPTTDFTKAEQFERMQGGAGTSEKRVNQDAFSQFSANLTFEEEGTFKLGNGLFRKLWVSSPLFHPGL